MKTMDLLGGSETTQPNESMSVGNTKQILFCAYNGCDCRQSACPFYAESRNACLKAEADILDLQSKYGISILSEEERLEKERLERQTWTTEDYRKWAEENSDAFLLELKELLRTNLSVPDTHLDLLKYAVKDATTVFQFDSLPELESRVVCMAYGSMVSDEFCSTCSSRCTKYGICLSKVRNSIDRFMTSNEYVNILRSNNPQLCRKYMCADCGKLHECYISPCDRCGSMAVLPAFDALLVKEPSGYYLSKPFGQEEHYFEFKYSADAVAHMGANDKLCTVGITEDGILGLNFTAPDGYRWCEHLSEYTLFIQIPDSEGMPSSKELAIFLEKSLKTIKQRPVVGNYIYGKNFILLEGWLNETMVMILSKLVNLVQLSRPTGLLTLASQRPDKVLNIEAVLKYQMEKKKTIASKLFSD